MAIFSAETNELMARAREIDVVDAATVLENLIQLDRMLDQGSRDALGDVHFLELSKHIRVKS